MAGVQGSALAIAVGEAGGMGSLPCAMLSVAEMRAELGVMRAGSERPFNVNFFCHTPARVDAAREARWLALLAEYYAEFGVDLSAGKAGGHGRAPFSDEAAEAIEDFKPAVVSFHFGLPSETLMSRVRRIGAKVFSSATTVAEARWLEARGVDAVIAQGYEAGGHRGMFLTEDLTTQVGTFALVPQIVNAVRVPVIAAGGIADAAGVRAAMELGAAAVQVGTAYLLCPEATWTAAGASCGVEERGAAAYGGDECFYGAAGAGDCESDCAGVGSDEWECSWVSFGGDCDCASAGCGRAGWEWGFFVDVVRAECWWMCGGFGCGGYSGGWLGCDGGQIFARRDAENAEKILKAGVHAKTLRSQDDTKGSAGLVCCRRSEGDLDVEFQPFDCAVTGCDGVAGVSDARSGDPEAAFAFQGFENVEVFFDVGFRTVSEVEQGLIFAAVLRNLEFPRRGCHFLLGCPIVGGIDFG